MWNLTLKKYKNSKTIIIGNGKINDLFKYVFVTKYSMPSKSLFLRYNSPNNIISN